MITKSFSSKGDSCKATFSVHVPSEVQHVSICADFNHWTPGSDTMSKNGIGEFSATLFLETNKRFHFKYLLDNGQWYNDSEADAYDVNEWGDTNSVIETFLPSGFAAKSAPKAPAKAEKAAPVAKAPTAPKAKAAPVKKAETPKAAAPVVKPKAPAKPKTADKPKAAAKKK